MSNANRLGSIEIFPLTETRQSCSKPVRHWIGTRDGRAVTNDAHVVPNMAAGGVELSNEYG